MNKNALCVVSVFFISSFVSTFAVEQSLADFQSSAIDGAVTCTTRGITVTMNRDRSSFTITQTREPALFNVVGDPQTNSVSSISYTGQLQLDHQKDEAILTFSNQGDTLEIGGRRDLCAAWSESNYSCRPVAVAGAPGSPVLNC